MYPQEGGPPQCKYYDPAYLMRHHGSHKNMANEFMDFRKIKWLYSGWIYNL